MEVSTFGRAVVSSICSSKLLTRPSCLPRSTSRARSYHQDPGSISGTQLLTQAEEVSDGIMSRDRFSLVMRFLHFNDSTKYSTSQRKVKRDTLFPRNSVHVMNSTHINASCAKT